MIAGSPTAFDDGFTLVEVLIAIVLVGLLSAVAVVGIGRLIERASTATCGQSQDAARIATASYYASHLRYPTTFDELTAYTNGGDGALVPPRGATVTDTTLTARGWALTMAAGTPPTFSSASSGAEPAAPTTTSVVDNGVTVSASNAGGLTYYGESILTLTNPAPLTVMTATISVRQTTGLTPSGSYTTFWGGTVTTSTATAAGFVVYTFTLEPGQTIVAGSWKLDGQWSGTGSPHATAGDTWRVVSTSQGRTTTLVGTY